MRLKTRDIILMALVVLAGGAGGARAIHSLSNQYLESHLRKTRDKNIEIEHFRNILSRLKKSKLIQSSKRGFWHITAKGKGYVDFLHRRGAYEEFKNNNKKKKSDVIIVFDIPEVSRKKRDYLRFELLALGYKPIQKSVWLGCGPLPQEFIKYLKEMKTLDYIHIFSIKEFGTIV